MADNAAMVRTSSAAANTHIAVQRRRMALVILIAVLGATLRAHAQSPADSDWGYYGGDGLGQHYSSLAQVDRGNVAHLQVAWSCRTGEIGTGFARAQKLAFEATPILAFGRLYLETPTDI